MKFMSLALREGVSRLEIITRVTLGILALVRVGDPAVLTTVGLLVLGAAITLSGTALSGKLLNLFRHA